MWRELRCYGTEGSPYSVGIHNSLSMNNNKFLPLQVSVQMVRCVESRMVQRTLRTEYSLYGGLGGVPGGTMCDSCRSRQQQWRMENWEMWRAPSSHWLKRRNSEWKAKLFLCFVKFIQHLQIHFVTTNIVTRFCFTFFLFFFLLL